MTRPLVSVVIPTYNYSKYITQAIESVLSQSYSNIEIIVIDDGSTDDTASVVGIFGDRIQYHFQKNQGLSAARNRGIDLSNGTYIQFLDSDDKLGPQSIESKIRFLDRNPNFAFACSPNRFFFEGKSHFYNLFQNLLFGWKLPNQLDLAASLCYGNIAPVHAFLTRVDTIKANRFYFDESLKACEDYDFWLRLATKCGTPGIVRKGLVYYRKHTTSMSSNDVNQLRFDAIMVERAYAALCANDASQRELNHEYLIANLAAALRIYYWLLHKGQHEIAFRLRDHIDHLRNQFETKIDDSQIRTTRYLSEMRIFALKLTREKYSLPASTAKLIDAIVGQRVICSWRYIYESLKVGNAIPEAMNIFYYDLQFIYLKLGEATPSNGRS